jgi:hypothetical protein
LFKQVNKNKQIIFCFFFLENKSILGSLLGRRSCQRLDVNRQYIVFLEPFFDGTYRPVDFGEVPYSDQINVLEKTCGLSRTYPFTETNDTEAVFTNKCPSAVSIDCLPGIFDCIFFEFIHLIFIETPKMTVPSSTAATTTTNSVSKSTTSSFLFGKDPIDLAALSLLLAEHQQQNLSLAFLQGQNHKSLFSDDDARKNKADRLSFILIINFIFCSFLCIIF